MLSHVASRVFYCVTGGRTITKLGYHVNVWTNAARGTVRTQRNGTILKVISTAIDRDEILRWKQNNPEGKVLYRQYFPNESLFYWSDRCDKLVKDAGPICDLIDIVETPWNEAHQTMNVGVGVSTIADLAAATIEATTYLKARWPDIKIAVGNFSVGNPPGLWHDWEAFLPALEDADYLSLHEYASPYVWSGPDAGALVELPFREAYHPLVFPSDVTLEGWWTLRYRKVYKWIEANYPDLKRPLLITECGRDHGLTKGKVAGWKAHGGNDPLRYSRELQWYAEHLALDDYVHGATIYACGTYDDFASFDVAGVGVIEEQVNEQISGPALWYPADKNETITDPPGGTMRETWELAAAKVIAYQEWRDTPGNRNPTTGPEGLQAFTQHLTNLAGGVDQTAEEAFARGFPRYLEVSRAVDVTELDHAFSQVALHYEDLGSEIAALRRLLHHPSYRAAIDG